MTEDITLKRSISLPLLTLYGIGTIVGAGIYVLVGKVAGYAGYSTPFSFLVGAVIAGFTAFTYAELASRYPKSAGESLYVFKAFGRHGLSAITGWSVVAIGIVSAATIANGFVGYLNVFITSPSWLTILLLVTSLGLIAAWGITESVWLATIITLIEIAGLVFVLIIAKDAFSELPEKLPLIMPQLDQLPVEGIFLGAFLAFYAFIGFEDMVNVAEEVQQPQRTIPRAIFLALVVSSLLYILIAFVAVLAIPPGLLNESDAPLATIVNKYSANSVVIISAISLVAVLNGALIQIIMASRVLYGMSQQGIAPKRFSNVHPRTQTPLFSTFFATILVLLMALWIPLVTLATITSYITLVIFAGMHVSLLYLKIRKQNVQGAVRYPAWVPLFGALICIALILFQINSTLNIMG